MADFVQEEVKKNICVVSITGTSPYDSSVLNNTADTFFVNINYKQLNEFFHIVRHKKETTNMTFRNILNYIQDKNTKVFFDFKCSPDCRSGESFINDHTTLLVFKVINTMTRLGCNIVVGDHSMASLFNNWNKHRMDFQTPIEVSQEHTSGPYKMSGMKSAFQKSEYPILKNLGDMSSDEKVEIEFENMSGTKIYSIKKDTLIPVEILSRGKSITRGNEESDMDQIVHSEFPYRNGKIIISATHWCNLTNVNSDVNVNDMREKYLSQFGVEETQQFEEEYDAAVKSGMKEEVKKVVSKSVKYMCSGVKD